VGSCLGRLLQRRLLFKGQDTITILYDSKNWWAQAEGMNTLLLLADHFPDDPMQY
jgi:mannobiose 2-epimerase